MDLFVVSGIKSKCAVSEKTGINTWNELKSIWRTALVFQLSLPNSCLSLLSTCLPKPFSSYGWDRLPFILIQPQEDRENQVKCCIHWRPYQTPTDFWEKGFPWDTWMFIHPQKDLCYILKKRSFWNQRDGAGNRVLSVALFGAAFTHTNDSFDSEALLRGGS